MPAVPWNHLEANIAECFADCICSDLRVTPNLDRDGRQGSATSLTVDRSVQYRHIRGTASTIRDRRKVVAWSCICLLGSIVNDERPIS